jgi:hypothetical protein
MKIKCGARTMVVPVQGREKESRKKTYQGKQPDSQYKEHISQTGIH